MKVKIEDGRITVGRHEVRDYVRSCEDGYYRWTLKEWEDSRSIQQNRLYWKWVEILAEYHGYAKKKAMHEVLLDLYAPIQTIPDLNGKPEQKPIRSKDMTVKQMSEYMDHVDRHAAQFDVQLPQPEPEMI